MATTARPREMWPGMPRAYFLEVGEWLRDCADACGLRQWFLYLDHRPTPDSATAMMTVQAVPKYQRARLWICDDFIDQVRIDRAAVRRTAAHEMVHVWQAATWRAASDHLEHLVAGPTWSAIDALVDEREEQMAEGLSALLAKNLPKPPKPPKG